MNKNKMQWWDFKFQLFGFDFWVTIQKIHQDVIIIRVEIED